LILKIIYPPEKHIQKKKRESLFIKVPVYTSADCDLVLNLQYNVNL